MHQSGGGINTFGKWPLQGQRCLKLEDPEKHTELAVWKLAASAKGYIEESINNKKNVSKSIESAINGSVTSLISGNDSNFNLNKIYSDLKNQVF